MTTTVRTDIQGTVATIWLDGIGQRNALSKSTWEAIPVAVAKAEAALDCRMIVLRGSGGHFGAGADIKEFATVFADRAATLDYFAVMEAAMARVEAAAIPTVAAIEGSCMGACVALALSCDIRLAVASSSFAITPAKLGIAYPYGDVRRVVQAIGANRTKSLMFNGRTIAADIALNYGLVDSVVDDLAIAIAELAGSMGTCSLWTIDATRQAISAVLAGKSAAEAGYPEVLVQAVAGADFAEGIRAFGERRPPVFQKRS